jgi:hypothetical protein
MCTSFGLNDPTKAEQACEVVQLLKMMLASPAAAPLTCQADAISPPPAQDKDGKQLTLKPRTFGSGLCRLPSSVDLQYAAQSCAQRCS